MKLSRFSLHSWLLFAVLGAGNIQAEDSKPVTKSESFDRDPGWEAHNNRLVPKNVTPITQNFGYSPDTHFAGKAAGEIGGIIVRATEPAFYAARITPKTLKEKLSASGTFAFTKSGGNSGIFFGWFNAKQPGGSRPMRSLGMDFDGEGHGLRLAVRMVTGSNKSCGTFITPFIPGKFRPTPIRNDGARYAWTLAYDPDAADGKGRFTFTLRSDAHPVTPIPADLPATHQQEARIRFPHTTTFSVDLPEGFKDDDMVFDRFGLMNMQRAGGPLTAWFDDLEFNGKAEDFSKEPADWESAGSRRTYPPADVPGAHNFGFSETANAGGKAGELGGTVWRTDKNSGWYADKVGPLSLDHRLEASGKVILAVGAPDSGACIGWFGAKDSDVPADSRDFVGVVIGGPTRVGHYFLPLCATAGENRVTLKQGPILVPGKPHEWTLLYDPAANNGNGAMRVTLDGESITLNLKPGQKKEGARLDHFGLASIRPGGGIVKIYFDDLKYTTNQLPK